MKDVKRRIVSIVLSLILIMTAMSALSASVYAGETDTEQSATEQVANPAKEGQDIYKVDVNDALKKTRNRVKSQMKNAYGNEEWYVMCLNRDGQTVSDKYYKSLYETVTKMQGSMEYDRMSYTNNAKTILTVTASGYDARNVAGYNLVAKLSDFDAIVKQGINGPIFALLALDSHNYEIPRAREGVTQATRENLVKYILDKSFTVTSSGGTKYCGWAYSNSATDADVDMTAMAMMALAPYKDAPEVAAKLEGAQRFLRDKYTRVEKDSKTGKVTKVAGTYNNSNSVACAIIGLTSMGVDPVSFIGGDYPTLVENLNTFLVKTGGYGFTNNREYNLTSTNDGYRALVAIQRMKSGMTSLYNMNDIKKLSILSSNGKTKSEGGESGKSTDSAAENNKDIKDSTEREGKAPETKLEENKRHLRFVQGDGGKPLTRIVKTVKTTDASEDGMVDESSGKPNDKAGISSDSIMVEDDSNPLFAPVVEQEMNRKTICFACIGVVFLALALIVLKRLVTSE